jgi:hypothetical protein
MWPGQSAHSFSDIGAIPTAAGLQTRTQRKELKIFEALPVTVITGEQTAAPPEDSQKGSGSKLGILEKRGYAT